MVEQKETKKEIKLRYSLGSIVTGTAPAIICDEKAMSMEEVLVEILNKLDKLEKMLG